jgi:hypothetical protein
MAMNRTAIFFLASVLGCGLFDVPSPDEARVLIEGEAGKQVMVITSTKFVASVNEDGQTRVVIFSSDTVLTTLPYERRYAIGGDQRFFAEASRLDADLQTVHLQVYLDEAKRFDEGGPLRDGQPYRFVSTFNQAVTREIVVL